MAVVTESERMAMTMRRRAIFDRLKDALTPREEAPAEAGSMIVKTPCQHCLRMTTVTPESLELYRDHLRAQPPARDDAQPVASEPPPPTSQQFRKNPAPDALRNLPDIEAIKSAITDGANHAEELNKSGKGLFIKADPLHCAAASVLRLIAALQAEQKGGDA